MDETNLRAFHGDSSLKQQFVDRVRAHRLAGDLTQDLSVWYKEKGSAVGEFQSYPELLGLPEWLAHLEDTAFHGLPSEQAPLWPEQFLEAIPAGADVSQVRRRLFHWLLSEDFGMLSADNRSRLEPILAMHERTDVSEAEWDQAETALKADLPELNSATAGSPYVRSLYAALRTIDGRTYATGAREASVFAALSLAHGSWDRGDDRSFLRFYRDAWVKIAQKLLELLSAA